MPPGLSSHDFCIACERTDTSFKASSKVNTLHATNAENSPRECPATISGDGEPAPINAAIE